MDFLAALSAVSSSASSGASPMGGANVVGNQVIQGGNGMKFSFELPKPVEGALPAQSADSVVPAASTGDLSSADGGGTVVRMVNQVNDYQATAGAKIRDVLMGGKTSLDDAMVSSQESSVAFNLLAQVRNKTVESYQTIMQMQI